jgi:hypothetical protein
MTKRQILIVVMLPLLVLALMACENSMSPGPVAAPLSPGGGSYAAAQATLSSGQSEITDLSHQATAISLNMEQAANAAAQTTFDANQRQLMELSIRGTEVSQNMAQAAAMQQYILEQTQQVWNATASAQSQAATATYSTYIMNITQTSEAEAALIVRARQTAEMDATRTAYSLTATPWAAIQADLVRLHEEAERRAEWQAYVVNPVKIFLLILAVLLLIAGGVIAFDRLLPVLEYRLLMDRRDQDPRLQVVDGEIVEFNPPRRRLIRRILPMLARPRPRIDHEVHIEIIGSSEPSIINWITEAEQKMRFDGRL